MIFTEKGHHLYAFGMSTLRHGEVHILWDEAQPSSSQSMVLGASSRFGGIDSSYQLAISSIWGLA